MSNGVFHSVFNRPPVKRYRDYFPIPRSSFTSSIMPKSQFMLARGNDVGISTVANFPVSQSFGIISKAISTKWILFRRLLFLFSHFIRYKGFSSFKPTLVSLKTPERILPWQVNQSNILGTVKYRGKKRRMCISVLISQWARNKTYTQQICNVLIIYKIWKLSFNSCCFFARIFFSKWKIILWLCVFCDWAQRLKFT